MKNEALSDTTKAYGKHIFAELWGCQCDNQLLTAVEPLMSLLQTMVIKAGLTVVGQVAYDFEQLPKQQAPKQQSQNQQLANKTQDSGITLSILLAESHICLHTWGEYKTVTLDIYVCNVSNDNTDKADAVFAQCLQIFQPQDYHVDHKMRKHRH